MSDDADKSLPDKSIPWKWLGAGLIVTIISCVAGYFLLSNYLKQMPSELVVQPAATIIVLTAPPSPTFLPTGQSQPPTPIPTFTPIPTPNTAVAPPEITAGFYVVVANTDDLGVTVRGGPSTRNVAILVAVEGSYFMVLDGPVEGDGFNWWQVQLEDGTSGWVAANFLEPSAAP